MKSNYGRTVEQDAAALGIDPARYTVAGRPGKPKVLDFTPLAEKPKAKARKILIKIPLPPRCLHPNGRGHWSTVAKEKKIQRSNAFEDAAAMGVVGSEFESPEISLTLYHADGQTRDRDGIISSVKSAIDGLQSARVFVNDSAVRWGSVECVKVQKRVECVIISISERKAKKCKTTPAP